MNEELQSPEIVKPRVFAKEHKVGLILVAPHGELIAKGEKTAILKSKKYEKYIDKEVYVIQGSYAYGKIKLLEPEEIGREEFDKRKEKHRVTEEERKRWAKRQSSWDFPIWYYPIKVIEIFPKPIPVRRKKGPQVFEVGIKLVPEMTIKELTIYHALTHTGPDLCVECSLKHVEIVEELILRGYEHLIPEYNVRDRTSELIRNWRTYDPGKVTDKVLRDDWRIVKAWEATVIKENRRFLSPQFKDLSLDQQKKVVKQLLKKIHREMKRRGWQPQELSELGRWFDTENQIRYQLREPPSKEHVCGQKQVQNGVYFLVCRKGDEPSKVYSIRFNKKEGWDKERARKWIKDHQDSLSFKLPEGMQIADIDWPYVEKISDKDLRKLHQYIHKEYKKTGEITEDLYNANVFILTEMRKRGMIDETYEDLDDLDRESRKAWLEYGLPGVKLDGTEELPLGTILKLFRQVGIIPVKGQPYGSYVTGGTVNKGKYIPGHDIDLLFRQKPDPRIIIALKKIRPKWLAKATHPVFDPKGPYIGLSCPVHGYALNPLPADLMTIGFGPFRQVLAKITPGKALIGVKPKSGFGKHEFWDTKECWREVGSEMIESGIFMEEKVDGRRFQLHIYDGKYKLITEDKQRDRSTALPELMKEIKKLAVKNAIIDGEIIVVDLPTKFQAKNARAKRELGEPIPREDTAALTEEYSPGISEMTVGKVPEEMRASLVYVIYDIMYLNGKQLTELPYRERRKIYVNLVSKNFKFIDYVRGEEAKTIKDFFKLASKYRSIKGSEGIVGKKSTFKYPVKFVGENRSRDMFKIKNLKEIDVIVLGIKQKETRAGKKLPTWMYYSYYEIPKGRIRDFHPPDIKEYKGKYYALIGTAYGTGEKARIGDIITVMPIRIRNMAHKYKGKIKYTWMFPYFKEVRKDKKEPDTLTTVMRLEKLGTGPTPIQKQVRSMSEEEFNTYLTDGEPMITIELEECPWWNYINVCPWRARFWARRRPQYLTIAEIEKCRLPVSCILAYHFKCHWIKDYYYEFQRRPIESITQKA